MTRQTVALIFGTRPEAVKMAPVYYALQARPDRFRPLIWLTGQHRQMLDQVMEVFELKSDRDFEIMKPGQTLTDVTIAVLNAMESALKDERPNAILVQGDTTTVFAASMAAFYAGVIIGHVEAGLRTNNKRSPYPEEINRRLTSQLADFHFAPTEESARNLLAAGTSADRVWVTGNTVIDALARVVKQVRATPPDCPSGLPARVMNEAGRRFVLITGHRRESFGSGFESICEAIRSLAGQFPDVEFVYPVHLNPLVREPVFRVLGSYSNVHLLAPLDYRTFVWMMDRCHLLLTDSGGIQEEAPYLGKPVLVMRDTTERPEAVSAGTARLVGTDTDVIVRETARLLDDRAAYGAMSHAHNPFGDGHAAERIADILAIQLAPPL